VNSATAAATAASIVIVINLADVKNPTVQVQTVQPGVPTSFTAGSSSRSPDASSTSLDFPPQSPLRSPSSPSRPSLSQNLNGSLPVLEPLTEEDDLHDYELIFDDDFTKSHIYLDNWSHEISCDSGRDGNEVQYYTHAFANAQIIKNRFNIVAREEWNDSSNLNFDVFDEHVKPVSSTHLTTKDKFNFHFGKLCISAKMPAGCGVWPKVTLLPNFPDNDLTAEIDLLEFVSISRKKYNTTMLKSGIMYGGKYPHVARAKNRLLLTDVEHPAYHFNEYCVDWEPDKIVWTINGKEYGRQEAWHQRTEQGAVLPQPEPFNEPFYISMKVAVANNWVAKTSRGSTSLPASMVIDWVKVWQKKP
jgi:beta-glucanase (GH16 family)